MVRLDELPELRELSGRLGLAPTTRRPLRLQRSPAEYIVVSRAGNMHWLELPAVKWATPIPLLAVIAPVVWWFFRCDLARARRRGAGAPARAGGARRDRLPADGRADDGGAHPDLAGVLRARRLLRPDDPAVLERPRARAPGRVHQSRPLRRALPAPVVGAHADRRLPGAARRLAALLPARPPRRLRAARARLPRARLDLRDVRGGHGAGAAARELPARLRQLLPDVQAGRALVARLRRLGAALPRPVLHAGDLLPRLLAARDARASARARSGRWSSPTA